MITITIKTYSPQTAIHFPSAEILTSLIGNESRVINPKSFRSLMSNFLTFPEAEYETRKLF